MILQFRGDFFFFSCIFQKKYVVDAEVPTEIRNLAGEIIEEAYVPEGIEDIHANSDKPVKVLNDGHLYILRGDHIYDTQGKMVK